jgi:hypothetical protein
VNLVDPAVTLGFVIGNKSLDGDVRLWSCYEKFYSTVATPISSEWPRRYSASCQAVVDSLVFSGAINGLEMAAVADQNPAVRVVLRFDIVT